MLDLGFERGLHLTAILLKRRSIKILGLVGIKVSLICETRKFCPMKFNTHMRLFTKPISNYF